MGNYFGPRNPFLNFCNVVGNDSIIIFISKQTNKEVLSTDNYISWFPLLELLACKKKNI